MIFPASRILVPDDLTRASRYAWAWARLFAGPQTRSEALFMFELPPVQMMEDAAPTLTAGEKARILARMRRARPGASSWRVEEGEAVSGILRRSRRADLVVMGTHARKGLMRAVLGSVAEGVARGAACPVLAARTPAHPVRSVLAPVSLEPYAFKGLALAAETAAFFGAELVVLHVSEPGARAGSPRFFMNGLIERLPAELRAKARPRLILRAGKPLPVILSESERHGLVVLTAHRKSLLGDFVLGTTVERTMRHAPVPVLAAPSAGR